MKEITLYMPKSMRCNRIHCRGRSRSGADCVSEAAILNHLLRQRRIGKRNLSRAIGRNDTYVSRRICLLCLPDEVLELLASGRLSASHGEMIRQAAVGEEERIGLARQAVDGHWSANRLETAIGSMEKRDPSHSGLNRSSGKLPEPAQAFRIESVDDGACLGIGRICTNGECNKRSNIRLGVIEEAYALKEAMDSSGLTCEQLSRRLGRYRGYVADRVRLLSLPETIRRMIEESVLSYRHGAALQKMLRDDKKKMEFARMAVIRRLSVHALERLIAENNGRGQRRQMPPEDFDIGDKVAS